MKGLLVIIPAAVNLVAAAVRAEPAPEWRIAQPGWQYVFPRDHHEHPEFKTEWWYFTGNLYDRNGRRFGYELTFFRHGIIPPAQRTGERSRFIVDDLKFAHFTVTDAARRQFYFDERASRGAFDEAGFDRGDEIAWIENWSVRLNPAGEFLLSANSAHARLSLKLAPVKAPVVHGENGISTKAEGEGHASHYYSLTRLTSTGRLQLNGEIFELTGASWFDHEWATNQLAPHQLGWNWLCVQFADGTELMLYQMRRDDASADRASSGTFVARDGTTTHLRAADFSMISGATWKSSKTGANYPVRWRVRVPSLGLDLAVEPVLENQELALSPLIYWEGAVDVSGSATGVGYLELTGYAASLSNLTR